MSTVTLTTRGALRKSDMREANERLLLNIIRQNPEVSRSDVARMTGFSPSSVTLIVNRMMRRGWIDEERSGGGSGLGRRPGALRLKPEAMVAIGVEIAAPAARVVAADLNGAFLSTLTVALHPNPKVLLSRVRAAIVSVSRRLSRRQSLIGVGVSLPGTIDSSSGVVFAAENLGWYDVEAGSMLSQGIPAPFYFENNARLAALAERWFNEPGTAPLNHFVFVTMHDGLGTGVIIDGKLLQGASGQAAEFGHTILFPEGRSCPCGNTGCWEEYASDRALQRCYTERRQGETVSGEEIVRRARGGDAVALECVRQTAAFAATGFVNVKQVFNPEAIIVGDYLALAWDLVQDVVWDILHKRLRNLYLGKLRIVPARHGVDSTIMGAVALVLSNFLTHFETSEKGPANSVSVHSTP
jgi:predicted NBD/HSP70 family sugar kinase